jgi:hypothetical protein
MAGETVISGALSPKVLIGRDDVSRGAAPLSNLLFFWLEKGNKSNR